MTRHGGLPALLALLAGCTQPPDRVFVPRSPFTHVVDARTAQGATAAVKTGEWLTLHARRRSGPWSVSAGHNTFSKQKSPGVTGRAPKGQPSPQQDGKLSYGRSRVTARR